MGRIIRLIKPCYCCKDCGVDTNRINEYYAVLDSVWAQAGKVAGMLCVGCLEQRLGRQLCRDDFKGCMVNYVGKQSERLKHRISG